MRTLYVYETKPALKRKRSTFDSGSLLLPVTSRGVCQISTYLDRHCNLLDATMLREQSHFLPLNALVNDVAV